MSRQPLGDRLKQLLAEYGPVALVIYLVIFGLVFGGFIIAIGTGYDPDGVPGNAGLVGAAWVGTKLTQPLRIAATLALTPLIGRVVLRRKVPANEEPSPPRPAA